MQLPQAPTEGQGTLLLSPQSLRAPFRVTFLLLLVPTMGRSRNETGGGDSKVVFQVQIHCCATPKFLLAI